MILHPRIRKEVRVLLWPSGMVILTVAAWLLWRALNVEPLRDPILGIVFWQESLGGTCVAFVIGAALLAAQAFGVEFQSRTLPILLSQPCSRLRLWLEKMLVLAGFAILGLLLFALMVLVLSPRAGFGDMDIGFELMVGYTFVPLVCSTGYWSLFTRSTIGGVILSFAAIGAVLLAGDFVVGETWEGQPVMVAHMTPAVLSVTSLTYAVLFLWLCWHRFARMELNRADYGEGGWSFSGEADASVASVLRSRPGSPLANLGRKEIRLLRPLLVIALLFAASWLGLTLLVELLPRQKDGAEIMLEALTGAYIALSLMLAGSLPLCDEYALGLHQGNLTLPVAARTQWLIKVGVALLAGLLAGVVLPVGLSAWTNDTLASPLVGILEVWGRFLSPEEDAWHLIPVVITADYLWLGLAAFGLLVLLGGWSATMSRRLIHALFLTLVAVLGLIAAGLLGFWLANSLPLRFGSEAWQDQGRSIHGPIMNFMTWGHVHFQFPISGWQSLAARHANDRFTTLPAILAATLVAGTQAWRAFRMPPLGAIAVTRALGWMAGVVTTVVGSCLVVLWGVANLTPYMTKSPLAVERLAAFRILKLPPSASQEIDWEKAKWTPVSLAELETTGKLSAQTIAWMTNSKLEFKAVGWVSRPNRASPELIPRLVVAREVFPDGETDEVLVRFD